jgi:6-pyruvoyltetrahydropterin/6-carboxytetrahydropterin synthase
MYELCVTSSFSAAHFLREYQGKCENLHGHNWDVAAYVSSTELNAIGMVIDFKDIKHALTDALKTLDHALINELPYFQTNNPSCEHIARYIFEQLALRLAPTTVSRVTVWETRSSSVTYSA